MCRRGKSFLVTSLSFRGAFSGPSLSLFILVAVGALGAGCVHGCVAGRGVGRSGSGDYECGHCGDPGGDGDPLSLGDGFGGTIRGGPAAAGAVFGAGGGGRDVAADFAGDSGGGGAAAQLTFKLKVAGPKETITVSEAPRMVEANPSSVSALVDERAIKDLPLNGRRFTDLLLLAPGVTQDPRGLTSGSNGDLSYGGIRGYNTSFLVDGGDNNNGFFAQATGRYRAPYQFSDEVVQEFRVQSSGYGAESGRAGGAVVNVVTKSGTNQWHGSTLLLSCATVRWAERRRRSLGFNPNDQQHQFGGDDRGADPAQQDVFICGIRSAHFSCAGGGGVRERCDRGGAAVGHVPDSGGLRDLRSCDRGTWPAIRRLVLASAAQLSTMGGTFPAKLLGDTGFLKLDRVLTPHQHLSARLSTSRYYGTNNVFL